MPIVGTLERIESGFAIGWAYRPDDSGPLEISVYLDDEKVAEGVTGTPRPDVKAAGGPLTAGFEIALPPRLIHRSGQISVRAAGEPIGERPNKRQQGVSELFAGSVEHMTGSVVTGWAVNLEQPNLPVALTVMLGARPISVCVTNVPRPDVQSQFGSRVPAGFAYPAPPFLRAGAPALLRFVVANTSIELGGSPFPLGGRRSADRAALFAFSR